MRHIAGDDFTLNDKWHPALNTLQLEAEVNLNELSGNKKEKTIKALHIFSVYAKESDFPQMQLLASKLESAITDESVLAAIDKAKEYENN